MVSGVQVIQPSQPKQLRIINASAGQSDSYIQLLQREQTTPLIWPQSQRGGYHCCA